MYLRFTVTTPKASECKAYKNSHRASCCARWCYSHTESYQVGVTYTLTCSLPFEFEENLRNCYEMIPKAFQSREREKCHLNEQSWIEAEVPLLRFSGVK